MSAKPLNAFNFHAEQHAASVNRANLKLKTMEVTLFQKTKETIEEQISVSIDGDGLHTDKKGLAEDCSSVWVKNCDGSRLSLDRVFDSILQRAIIAAIEKNGELDM